MEGEVVPTPKPTKPPKWRQWLLPVLFTSLLYIILGAVVWFYGGLLPSDQASSVVDSTAGQVQIQSVYSGSAITTNPIQTNQADQIAAENDLLVTQTTNKSINTQVDTPNKQADTQTQNITAIHNQAVLSAVNQPTIDAPQAGSPAFLSDAEMEAERQNDLLRQAIDQVRQINEQKLAQTQSPTFFDATDSLYSAVTTPEKVDVAQEQDRE